MVKVALEMIVELEWEPTILWNELYLGLLIKIPTSVMFVRWLLVSQNYMLLAPIPTSQFKNQLWEGSVEKGDSILIFGNLCLLHINWQNYNL